MTQAGKRAGGGGGKTSHYREPREVSRLSSCPPKRVQRPRQRPPHPPPTPARAPHTFRSALLPGALQRTQGASARPRQSQRCRSRLLSSSSSAEAEPGAASLRRPSQASNEEALPQGCSWRCKRVHWGARGEAGTL